MNKTLIYVMVFLCAMALGIGIVSFFNKKEATNTNQEQTESVIWTCSMHSEIQQDEPGTCPKCNMQLIPLDQDLSSLDLKIFQLNESVFTASTLEA